MVDHIANRDKVLQQLKHELFGPAPAGREIDCSVEIRFDTQENAIGPWRQQGTGEEILLRDPPTKRYGVGVLYPFATQDKQDRSSSEYEVVGNEIAVSNNMVETAEEIARQIVQSDLAVASDDVDLSDANALKPSTLGLTFLVALPHGSSLVVEAQGGCYEPKSVLVAGDERKWWLRKQISLKAEFPETQLLSRGTRSLRPAYIDSTDLGGLDIELRVVSRPQSDPRQRLVTVCLINRTDASGELDSACLFQSFFKAYVRTDSVTSAILQYPERSYYDDMDAEEASIDLVYRKNATYATGHGCAANWGLEAGPERPCELAWSRVDGSNLDARRMNWVSAECLPTLEVPNMTPTILRADGSDIEVSMSDLASIEVGDSNFAALSEIVALYEEWIRNRQQEIALLDQKLQRAARRNLDECWRCAGRMRDGILFLETNSQALTAFKLANKAILLQQIRYRRVARQARFDVESLRLQFSEPFVPAEPLNIPENRGKWRAFQIAFLLMSIRSCVDKTAPDRDTVELIWFPTGGGKTEAYLGLAAFSMLMERIVGSSSPGVHVLMRYTLRLLTAQQFQRASGLICALEYLRRQNIPVLGQRAFSIGIWLGGDTTPNKREHAKTKLRKLQSDQKYEPENPFVIGHCPWCGAQLGRLKYDGKVPKNAPRVVGYVERGNTVAFECSDNNCMFARGLPIYVIDEDVYEFRPSLVIGTVDKFAMLAWEPRARALFGLDAAGRRAAPPPNLIIQDELHLISGPLGSMVGLYETIIETLCTELLGNVRIRPKLVSSTATIRRYREQIRSLYARDDVALFPPPGLDASDSFFARYDADADGKLRRGRIYVGIHAPGLGSIQTAQVRTFSALLQAPVAFSSEERDPWWSLLLFFNSLRELGTSVSLLQSDIPDYLQVIRRRFNYDNRQIRWVENVLELTGRLDGDDVRKALDALEATTVKERPRPVDVCLASSIVEVGVDIDRLSIMAVVGQPKTTSQYIQVTGRVGRRTRERPGLVVTIYGASKPRDRSHFERFRTYHERLYAQVEPTSVTPFCPPALDRALHAILVAYVRQAGNEAIAEKPYPYPQELVEEFRRIVMERVAFVDANESGTCAALFQKRADEWRRWERYIWSSFKIGADMPLLRMAGSYATKRQQLLTWQTPMSMRNVDAECKGVITELYLQEPSNA